MQSVNNVASGFKTHFQIFTENETENQLYYPQMIRV